MAEKTEHQLREGARKARAKGQGVGRSAELSMGLTLGVGLLALSSLLPGVAATLISKTQNSVTQMSPHATKRRADRPDGRRVS